MSLVAGAAAAFIVALVPLAPRSPTRRSLRRARRQAPPSLWHLGLNADAMWYQNGTFTSSAADSTWSTGGRAGLGYTRRFRTGTFGVGGWGGTIYYPEAKDLRQPTYGGSLAAERRSLTTDAVHSRAVGRADEHAPHPVHHGRRAAADDGRATT